MPISRLLSLVWHSNSSAAYCELNKTTPCCRKICGKGICCVRNKTAALLPGKLILKLDIMRNDILELAVTKPEAPRNDTEMCKAE